MDVSTGAVRWEFSRPNALEGPIVGSRFVYVTSDDTGQEFALAPETGAVRWTFKAPYGNFLGSPILMDGILIVSGVDTLYGLDPQTGAVRWSSLLSPIPPPDMLVAGRRHLFYALIGSRSVAAFSSRTGNLVWLRSFGSVDENGLLTADGRAFVPASRGRTGRLSLVALSGPRGATAWVGPGVNTDGAIVAGLVVTGIPRRGGRPEALVGLDPRTGAERWRHVLAKGQDIETDVTRIGREACVGLYGTGGGTVLCLDARTGRELWSRPVQGRPQELETPGGSMIVAWTQFNPPSAST